MPLKFKIYYSCCLYVLLWCCGMIVFTLFAQFVNKVGRSTGYMFFFILMHVLLIAKLLTGLKAISLYKAAAKHSKAQRRLFIAGFCVNLLITMFLAFVSVLIIKNTFLRPRTFNYYSVSPIQPVYGVLFIIAAICCIFFAITDLMLLKAVRLKQPDNLMSFELNDELV